MSNPNSRQTLKDYALRKLGFPVIDINVDNDQVDDRVDEAIDIFQQYHMDATTKVYLAVTIDANTVNNKVFVMPNTMIGVTRVFPLSAAVTSSTVAGDFNIFDLNYQLRLNELYDFTSADYVYFELAQQHIRTLELLFIGEPPIRFNRYDGQLFVDLDWNTVNVGSKIVVEGFAVLPENNQLFWNDNWLKKFTVCLVKEQWGNNLKKFSGVPLPGNITLNGQQIYNEAVDEKKELLQELHDRYEMPPEFIVG